MQHQQDPASDNTHQHTLSWQHVQLGSESHADARTPCCVCCPSVSWCSLHRACKALCAMRGTDDRGQHLHGWHDFPRIPWSLARGVLFRAPLHHSTWLLCVTDSGERCKEGLQAGTCNKLIHLHAMILTCDCAHWHMLNCCVEDWQHAGAETGSEVCGECDTSVWPQWPARSWTVRRLDTDRRLRAMLQVCFRPFLALLHAWLYSETSGYTRHAHAHVCEMLACVSCLFRAASSMVAPQAWDTPQCQSIKQPLLCVSRKRACI